MSEEWEDDYEEAMANIWADSVTGSDHCLTGRCNLHLTLGAKLKALEQAHDRAKRRKATIEKMRAIDWPVDVTDDTCRLNKETDE